MDVLETQRPRVQSRSILWDLSPPQWVEGGGGWWCPDTLETPGMEWWASSSPPEVWVPGYLGVIGLLLLLILILPILFMIRCTLHGCAGCHNSSDPVEKSSSQILLIDESLL